MVSNSRCACNRKCKSRSKGNNKKNKPRTIYDVLNKNEEYRVPYVDWSVSEEQLEEIAKDHEIIPLYISFRTKPISNIHYVNNKIIRDIHFRYKKGHMVYTIPYSKYEKLSKDDFELLETYGIKSSVVKWRIFLN